MKLTHRDCLNENPARAANVWRSWTTRLLIILRNEFENELIVKASQSCDQNMTKLKAVHWQLNYFTCPHSHCCRKACLLQTLVPSTQCRISIRNALVLTNHVTSLVGRFDAKIVPKSDSVKLTGRIPEDILRFIRHLFPVMKKWNFLSDMNVVLVQKR